MKQPTLALLILQIKENVFTLIDFIARNFTLDNHARKRRLENLITNRLKIRNRINLLLATFHLCRP